MKVISKVFKNVRKFLLRSVKWGVFGGYSVSSHAQPTIFSSSTILFQPKFARLLKLPLVKKIVFTVAVLCGILSGLSAETLLPENVNQATLQKMLSSRYPVKTEQGVLYAEVNKTLIRVVPIRKSKLLCLSVAFGASDQRSISRMKELANSFNYRKRLIRVGIGDDGTSYCTYYVVYTGGLNDKNLFSALDWFYLLAKSWCEYVYMDGKEQ